MNILVNNLKKFQKLSAHVTGSNIIPIHHYLRIGGGKIIKNVNTSFIEYSCDMDDDEHYLVDENDLYALLKNTTSSFISISSKKNKIELNDGRDKIVLQSPPVKEFSLPPVPKGESIELSDDFMKTVQKASGFAQFVKDMPTYCGYIHVGENTICAGDGIVAFHCPISENVKMVIDNKIARTISEYSKEEGLKISTFKETENFYYFMNEQSIFGFAKSEIGWFDIRRIFQQKREYSFTLDSSYLTSFNSLSLRLSKTGVVTISDGKFEMDDILFNKHHERDVDNVNVPAPFTYNPERMNTIISGLDVEALDFSDSKPAYYISSKDSKATAIIAKISK